MTLEIPLSSEQPKPINERKDDLEYNGWKGNGESRSSARFTWLTALWVSNEPFLDTYATHIAMSYDDDWKAGEALKEFVAENVIGEVLTQASLASDMLRSVLDGQVNWTEIVAAYRDNNP